MGNPSEMPWNSLKSKLHDKFVPKRSIIHATMHFNPAGDTRLAAPIRCTAALLAGESQNVGKLFSPADICHNIPTWETPAKCSESLHSQNCTKSFLSPIRTIITKKDNAHFSTCCAKQLHHFKPYHATIHFNCRNTLPMDKISVQRNQNELWCNNFWFIPQ